MNYCKRCLYPDTKPDLFFTDGVCSACLAFDAREKIDWTAREQEFIKLVEKIKERRAAYDCIVPVSGGKDSHYQVIKAVKYGLRVLAVNAVTDDLSDLGRRNLNNIATLGADVLEVSTQKAPRKRIAKYALEKVGDISWAEHVTIFTVPVHMAVRFDVPLILWGENAQNEYGGPAGAQQAIRLDNRWLQEYGGLNGLRVQDLIDQRIATRDELYFYIYPISLPKEFLGLYLGQFFSWDGLQNAIIAQQNGFTPHHKPVEGVGYDYENLDNYQTGVHDYFKYLKFGFGRCTDLVNNHIRRGRITRRDGRELVLSHDGKYPATYLGKSLEEILGNIDCSIDEFLLICNKFANPALFDCAKGRAPRALFKQDLKNA